MASSRDLQPGESVVVRVTARPKGLVGPTAICLAGVIALALAAHHWTGVRHAALWISLALVPPFVVVMGRLGRWRSHKIVVSTQRVIASAGVARRHRASLPLRDILAVHVEQSLFDRVTRRGIVVLETPHESFSLDRVRRPDALARVIDFQRTQIPLAYDNTPSDADELDEARDIGLASDDEYDERWRHLFGWTHRPR